MDLNRRKALRAFSLIELMIVLVVLAILAAVIIPKFADHARRGKEAGLKHDLSQLRTAIATYQADTDRFPQFLSDLAATSAPLQGLDGAGTPRTIAPGSWHGPYIGALPADPISGGVFTYTIVSPSVGSVASSASGNDSNGVPFSSY